MIYFEEKKLLKAWKLIIGEERLMFRKGQKIFTFYTLFPSDAIWHVDFISKM